MVGEWVVGMVEASEHHMAVVRLQVDGGGEQ